MRIVILLLSLVFIVSCPATRENPPATVSHIDTTSLSHELDRNILKTAKAVAEFRKLSLPSRHGCTPFCRAMASENQLKDYILQRYEADYHEDEVYWQGRLLQLLDILPENVDYQEMVTAFLVDNVGGFYDPIARYLYLANNLSEQHQDSVVVHEIVHLLQDKAFDLKPVVTRSPPYNDDGQLTRLAVAEGDATLVMLLFQLKSVGVLINPFHAGLRELIDETVGIDYSLNDKVFVTINGKKVQVPKYVLEMAYFPYFGGARFALARIKQSGIENIDHKDFWKLLDQAFRQAPKSTAEILHPELYQRDNWKPVKLSVSSSKADALAQLNNTMGEQGCLALLSQKMSREKASEACEGWYGDRYSLWGDKASNSVRFVWKSHWQRKQDAKEFEQAMQQYLAKLKTDISYKIKRHYEVVTVKLLSKKVN